MLLACGAFSRKCYKNHQKTAFFTPGRGGQFGGDVPRKAPQKKSYTALTSCPGTGPGTDCTYFRRKMKKRTSLNLLARHFGAPQKKKNVLGENVPQKKWPKNGERSALHFDSNLIYAWTHTCRHTYIHTYIHTCIHTYTHTCIHTRTCQNLT